MEIYRLQAIEKLSNEFEELHCKSRVGQAVSSPVCEVLKDFCKQDEEFAQAIVQSDKTLTDCLEEISKSVGSSISDIEVYKRAVGFYFPGAGIDMKMTVDLCASVRGNEAEHEDKPDGKVIDLSMSDLFGDM